MPDISTKATVGIELNTQPVGRKIAELETKLDKLNEKKRQFEAAGDQKGLVKIQKEINKVSRQLDTARTASERCKAALAKLNESSPKELRHTLKQLKADLDHMERGSAAWKAHVEAIKRVKAEIKSVDAELREHEGLLSRINRKVNEWGMSIASAAAAFTGLIFTARQAVQAYADMEAEMANVRKFTGMTADEVDKLNEAFKGMDTRTSREDLNKLAQEAGRLGLQSQEDVLGFVKAADQINVALDDLGEGATLTLSKLTDIFGDKQRLGVEQSLLSVGSVINELSQNCTASAPYLAQFAQRMAGVGKQANMTIPEIMGFAAVLDSQGQALEMSATAVSQLIMKLFQDPAKIAKATGMDLQAFNKVLKEDTNEALLMLFDRLHELGDLSVLAPVFDAMGTDGARASQVIAALAGNVAEVKKQQKAANAAFKEGTSVTKEYNVQNNTVQAGLDKAKKRFHEMAIELGEKLAPAMKYVITGTSAMMRVLSATISFISEYKVSIIAVTAAITGFTIAVNAATIAEKAKIVWDKLVVFWNETVKASFTKLWATIMANPYAALGAAIIAVAAVLWDLTKKTRNQTQAEKDLISVEKRAIDIAADEITTLKMLYERTQDVTASTKDRKAAVHELQRIYPAYFANLSDEAILAGKAADQYERLTNAIIAKARAEGAREIIKENSKKIMQLQQERDEKVNKLYKDFPGLQYYIATGGGSVLEPGTGRVMSSTEAATKFDYPARIVETIEKNTAAVIKGYEDSNEKLAKQVYDIESSTPRVSFTPTAPTPAPYRPSGGGGGGTSPSSHPRNNGGGGNGSHANPEEEALKKMKAEIEALTTKKNEDLTKLNDQYRKGELASYDDYVDKQYNRTKQYYDDVLAVYKKYGQDQSKDAADVRTKQADDEAKHDKEMLERKKRSLEQQRDADKMAAQMRYYEPTSDIFHNQQALDNELARIDIEYLEKVRDLTKENTKERADAEIALEKAKQAEILRQRKVMDQNYQTWIYAYSLKGAKERMAAELAILEELHKKGKVSEEEEYQQAIEVIRKKYRDEIDSKTGTSVRGQAAKDAELERDQRLAYLEQAKEEGLVTEEEYQHRRWEIISNYHDKISELVKGEGSEWATMVTDLVTNWQDVFANLGDNLADILENIGDAAAATFAVMNAGLTSYSNYAKACSDLELANLKKKYEEDIAAKNLTEKQKENIEKNYRENEKKLKDKANKRAQKIEIAQAEASTALGAIRAYTSALEAGFPLGLVLAPIAAAAALAAGAMQIATIRKQHQAEQAGYYEGGFTGRDANNRREAGVVHANEFVANHRAVANPELMPVLRLIDHAQRNNTVGSLTREDVSRAIGQGAILGDMTVAQQRSAEQHDTSMVMVAASMERQTDAINELNARLADGIESFMVMDGERGFDRSWERYQRMKNNPKR